MLMTRKSPSTEQRREIFAREVALDLEAIEALECAIQNRPNDDIRPQIYADCLSRDLETMSALCQGWLASGPPDPEHYDSLEDYLALEFGRSLDALELILVFGGWAARSNMSATRYGTALKARCTRLAQRLPAAIALLRRRSSAPRKGKRSTIIVTKSSALDTFANISEVKVDQTVGKLHQNTF
ncbi:MAG TPA: hypothetical protein VM662_15210 [Sphingomonas sp.]|nr:hypothetical protein [Sphingomonas sp.]